MPYIVRKTCCCAEHIVGFLLMSNIADGVKRISSVCSGSRVRRGKGRQ